MHLPVVPKKTSPVPLGLSTSDNCRSQGSQVSQVQDIWEVVCTHLSILGRNFCHPLVYPVLGRHDVMGKPKNNGRCCSKLWEKWWTLPLLIADTQLYINPGQIEKKCSILPKSRNTSSDRAGHDSLDTWYTYSGIACDSSSDTWYDMDFRTNVLHHILMCMCIFVCIQKEKERERETHIERERGIHTVCIKRERERVEAKTHQIWVIRSIYANTCVCVYCTHTCYVDINVTCNVYDMWYSCPEKKMVSLRFDLVSWICSSKIWSL